MQEDIKEDTKKIDYQSMLLKQPLMTHSQISKLLPHRYPFLLVDKVVLLEEMIQIVGIKNVTINEEFFNGHFPNFPIMPGVLIIEAMAQISGILGVKSAITKYNLTPQNPPNVFLMSIDNIKFRHPVIPGDSLILHSVIEKTRGDICVCNCQAYVLDKKVCEAKITAKLDFNS